MNRHEFLRGLHELLSPRGYLEIGVRHGDSLTLSRTRSIAVDPAFKLTSEIHCDVQLVKATSDDFFARPDPLAHLPGGHADLAFIDGMHLAEFAFRDFMNVERYCDWTSVVVFDDMLPRSVAEAARDRHTVFWAGDVFKVATVLRRLRPDLVVLGIDTEPTGVVVVLGADPADTILQKRYDEVLAELMSPDPQSVPDEILTRAGSADPEKVLASDVWSRLVAAREAGADRDPDVYGALASLAGTGPVRPVVAPPPKPWRDPAVARAEAAAAARRPRKKAAARAAARRGGARGRARRLLRRLANRL